MRKKKRRRKEKRETGHGRWVPASLPCKARLCTCKVRAPRRPRRCTARLRPDSAREHEPLRISNSNFRDLGPSSSAGTRVRGLLLRPSCSGGRRSCDLPGCHQRFIMGLALVQFRSSQPSHLGQPRIIITSTSLPVQPRRACCAVQQSSRSTANQHWLGIATDLGIRRPSFQQRHNGTVIAETLGTSVHLAETAIGASGRDILTMKTDTGDDPNTQHLQLLSGPVGSEPTTTSSSAAPSIASWPPKHQRRDRMAPLGATESQACRPKSKPARRSLSQGRPK